MPLDLNADVDAMLADDLGVDVVIGGVSGRGFFDESATLTSADTGLQFQQRVLLLTVRTGVFQLRDGAQVKVGGVTYLVMTGWEPTDDGRMTLVPLQRLST